MFVQPEQKHNSDKMPIAPTSSQPCSKPNVSGSAFCQPVNEKIMILLKSYLECSFRYYYFCNSQSNYFSK